MDRYYRNFPPPLTPRYMGCPLAAVPYLDWYKPPVEHGQDWPATKEEESRMKPIDFSKPLRTTAAKYPVEVIKEGVTLVQWHTPDGRLMRAAVDEKGELQPTEDWHNASFRVENVPEPKREYLHLYQVAKQGEWLIDKSTGRDSQLYTKQEADEVSAWNVRYGNNTVVVKVEA